ncbi:MAG: hypothetical protein R3F59_02050 [Myxococcota bacterium]
MKTTRLAAGAVLALAAGALASGCIVYEDHSGHNGGDDSGDAPQRVSVDRIEDDIDVEVQLVDDVDVTWEAPDTQPWSLTCGDTDPERIRVDLNDGVLHLWAENESGQDCVLLVNRDPKEIVLGGNGRLKVERPLQGLPGRARRQRGEPRGRARRTDQLTVRSLRQRRWIQDLRTPTLTLDVPGAR